MIFGSQDDVCVLYSKSAYFVVEVLELAYHHDCFCCKTEHFGWTMRAS